MSPWEGLLSSVIYFFVIPKRGEDERRSAKERGRGSKPRNALALGLRAVPSPYSPYIRKDLLLASFEIVLPSTDHLVHVRCQNATSGKIVERCADDSEKDRHEITALSELRRKCPQPETEQRAWASCQPLHSLDSFYHLLSVFCRMCWPCSSTCCGFWRGIRARNNTGRHYCRVLYNYFSF